MASAASAAVFYALPVDHTISGEVVEGAADVVLLGLLLIFHYRYRKRSYILDRTRWIRFGYIPVISIVVIMALTVMTWQDDPFNSNVRVIVVLMFAVINGIILYCIGNILEKESDIYNLQLLQERTQNQMNIYQSMLRSYERQRRYLHDYKNQLNCIQGLLSEGKTQESIDYIAQLTGSLQKSADYINTNHTVVNVVLNQKYQYALEKDITMTLSVNDLSGLTFGEEDIVIILVNLLDNAIEACEELDGGRVIQFKMTLEPEQLILSIRNPVKVPFIIRNKRLLSTKRKSSGHGIGLQNVDAVISRHGGSSVMQCENGWFYFSAVIPVSCIFTKKEGECNAKNKAAKI
ncbi:GHKL domain-containing protein [Ruminococcus sp. OA3]|uniref:sensor histidine kinase n=1 Tax=Ruminococcus sp. OA3 TaxID=2914164 RepID=UPI001F057C03|nr:sensor histidine kinase [Ruminococcus sp. OA3]MCH1981187.1 GHKL domain-containing protein [Ruminococcus sp. OA3]